MDARLNVRPSSEFHIMLEYVISLYLLRSIHQLLLCILYLSFFQGDEFYAARQTVLMAIHRAVKQNGVEFAVLVDDILD